MERRFELRKEAILAKCKVAPQVFCDAIERLGGGGRRNGKKPIFTEICIIATSKYLLKVAGNKRIQDLTAIPSAYSSRGRYPKQPFQLVHQWRDSLAGNTWAKIKVRDAEKGLWKIISSLVQCGPGSRSTVRLMTKH